MPSRIQRMHHRSPHCEYCSRPTILNARPPELWTELDATTDHKIPKALGGDNSNENVALACRTCNGVKGGKTPAQWFFFMETNPNWWEAFKWKQRKPRLDNLVAHNAVVENAWQRDFREWHAMNWPWLKVLTRERLWQVGWGPWGR